MSWATLLLAIAAVWLVLLAAFYRRLLADWREPVLFVPVLIVESDDWGPGPPSDADRLQELSAALQVFHDCRGHPPVVTLGVVLGCPGAIIECTGNDCPGYVLHALDADEFLPIRNAMLTGRDAGVFALQLHGMEHFWPPALTRAAQRDPFVRAFLNSKEQAVPRHEALPPHLQARWIDASRLPSVALAQPEIERAVAEETACFERVFGVPAQVAVPVTFTWTTEVEAAWASHGIRVVVTPGTRNIGRDGQGGLIGDGSILRNGDIGVGGIVHVVRDIYFEPALGHTAERTMQQIREHHRLGRPALLEMHRFNFTGAAAQAENSLAELRRLLQGALAAMPQFRYMSTETLAEALRERDPALIDGRFAARVRAFVRRAATQQRLRKLAWISGLAVAAAALLAMSSALLAWRASETRIGE